MREGNKYPGTPEPLMNLHAYLTPLPNLKQNFMRKQDLKTVNNVQRTNCHFITVIYIKKIPKIPICNEFSSLVLTPEIHSVWSQMNSNIITSPN